MAYSLRLNILFSLVWLVPENLGPLRKADLQVICEKLTGHKPARALSKSILIGRILERPPPTVAPAGNRLPSVASPEGPSPHPAEGPLGTAAVPLLPRQPYVETPATVAVANASAWRSRARPHGSPEDELDELGGSGGDESKETKDVAAKVMTYVAEDVAKVPASPVMRRERVLHPRSASPLLHQAPGKKWKLANKGDRNDSWLNDSEECAGEASPQGERSHTSRAPYLVTAWNPRLRSQCGRVAFCLNSTRI